MRRVLELLFVALLALWLSPSPAAEQRPIRIGFLYSDGNLPGTLKAYDSLLRAHPELRGRVQLTALTESTFDSVKPDELLQSDVLVLDMMNEGLLTRFDSANKSDLIRAVKDRGTVLAVGQGLRDEKYYAGLGVRLDDRMRAYWQHAGSNNQLGLLEGALTAAGVRGLKLPAPESSLDFGYYYPDAQGGRVFASWDAFQTWRRENGKLKPGAPRIAVTFFKASYYSGDSALLEALVAEIERQGGEAVPAFGYPGAVSVDRLLRDEQGRARADAILSSNLNFADSDTAGIVERAGMPAINLITLYGRSEADWRGSPSGLSNFEGTFNLAVPEFAGTIAPTVVASKEKRRDPATGVENVVTQPIAAQVKLAVARAMRYARLRAKPNATKHVALMFYNYPPGKAGIGASYLNVAESLANLLARMGREGYDLGGPSPDAARVLDDITHRARNVGGDAPGELAEMLRDGSAARVPMNLYREWVHDYAPSLRAKIQKDWGAPENAKLMVSRGSTGAELVIPQVRYGNVILLPQPARAWGEDLEKLYHAKDLSPHPQYVATYEWLKRDFKADAVVHLGTHGTLEWLDGKDAGLSPEDAPDALIGDLPNIYIYNVDVVGEGLVARRRSEAALIDHMVPPFRKGGLTPDLAALGELLNDHTINESKNPQLAENFARQARERAVQLGVAKDLALDPAREWTDEELHRVENYLTQLRGQNIPYGLHAFGRTPEPAAIRSTVEAIVAIDRSLLPDQQKVLGADMTTRITTSGPRELDSFIAALGGRALPSGTGGEPLRNPSSYATGRNFYGIDPDKVPKKASWEMGVKLGEQMIAEHLKSHAGRYPEKVSFVIWGDETMRHEGVLESQIFWLLGTRPVWDARGKVVGVDVIPRSQLGRPRVDIVIASAAEGMFANVTHLMDEAVQKVKAMEEADNLVRKHYLATRATLIQRGRSPEEADRLAGVRIFDEPPGTFNLNTSTIVAHSGSWDSDAGFANDYIRKMGHGYGNGFNGEAMEDVFRLALDGVETVVHSSSTALYGALDNDDMFMYMGGLAAAVRSVGGKTPGMVVTNTRDPGNPEMTGIDKFIGQEFRSRYTNPTWIEGMKKEGYAGAGEMRAFVEYLWGWDATVTDVVDDAMWQKTFSVYVKDEYKLGLKQFFEDKSPFAYQDMTARMLETVRKGYWKADEATQATLLNEYLDSVARHGANCTENSCGNARLLRFILDRAATAGVPAPTVASAKAALEKAMGETIESSAARLEAFAMRNERRERREMRERETEPTETASTNESPAPVQQSSQATGAERVQGYLMEQERRDEASSVSTSTDPPSAWRSLTWSLPLLILLFAWRWREHRRAPVTRH